MIQHLQIFVLASGPLHLARNVGDANRSAIKPKTGHARIVPGAILLPSAHIKVQGQTEFIFLLEINNTDKLLQPNTGSNGPRLDT